MPDLDGLTALFRFPAPVEVLVADSASPSALLSDDQAARSVRLVGPITADRDFLLPAIDGADFIVEIATTGAHSVRPRTSVGTGPAMLPGDVALLRCSGSDYAIVGDKILEVALDVSAAGTIHITKVQAARELFVLYGTPPGAVMLDFDELVGGSLRPGQRFTFRNLTSQTVTVSRGGSDFAVAAGKTIDARYSGYEDTIFASSQYP